MAILFPTHRKPLPTGVDAPAVAPAATRGRGAMAEWMASGSRIALTLRNADGIDALVARCVR